MIAGFTVGNHMFVTNGDDPRGKERGRGVGREELALGGAGAVTWRGRPVVWMWESGGVL